MTVVPTAQGGERGGGGGGGHSLTWAILVCAALKGRVFQPFWS